MLSNARILDYMQILQWCRATKGQQVICINLKILQHTLPHGTLSLIISTLIVNIVQMKYLIHPIEERKSQQPDQSKWEDLQGSSFDHTSMISSRICPRINVMILLNGKITIIMSVNVKKHYQVNSNKKSKTYNKAMKKIVRVEVTSVLF